jgi:TRAP-type C4-dicarboxylate transport system permease small subunit
MRKALDGLYRGSLVLAGLFLVGIFVLMIAESVLRKLGSFVPGANELIGWFCAAAGFLALPATFKRGDMVRVGLLVDRLAPPLRKGLLLGCALLALAFTSFLCWAAANYLWAGHVAEETTQGMIEIPVWIPQLSFLFGAVLLWIAVLDELIGLLRAPAATLRAERAPAVDERGAH